MLAPDEEAKQRQIEATQAYIVVCRRTSRQISWSKFAIDKGQGRTWSIQ